MLILVKSQYFYMDISGKKTLWGANLQGVDLVEAKLQEAKPQGAKLQGAQLQGSDLQGAQHLSVYQLSKMKTLHSTKLDEELLILLKKVSCPFWKTEMNSLYDYQ